MKRILAAMLIAALMLTGCSAKAATAPKTEQPENTPQVVTPLDENSSVEEIPEQTEMPTEAQPAPEAPQSSASETQPAEKEEDTAQATPSAQVTPPKTESAQTAPVKPQQTTPPAQPVQSQPATSLSGRPTSSATCKDTGSDRIWENPDTDAPDLWEVEPDPTRQAYLEYLKRDGNPFYFWNKAEDGMLMHLGRAYGIPLYTSYDIFINCTWSCSDPAIASVNEVGYVVPLHPGTASITVSYTDPETQEVTTRACMITIQGEPVYTYAQLEQRAHEEAKKIADYAMNYEGATTDLEKISIAAGLVYQYVRAGKGGSSYHIVDGELVSCQIPGYNQPFGTLVTFHSTCAGDVRALGLVLEYMGFSWYHTNENQWEHQWCVVYDVDGQTAFADASTCGIVGYGQRQDDRSNWMHYYGGSLVPFA